MEKEPLKSTFPSVSYRVLQIPRLLFLGLRAPSHGTQSAVLREHAWDADKKRPNVTATNHVINVSFSKPLASMPRGRKTESKELEEQIDVYDQLLRRLRFNVDVHDREVTDRVLNRVGISLQSSYAIIPG
ncbi:C6 finger domain protein, putative [Aspergillus fumigatus A1163]|uniref:C6 finger domain protein, putative n=2 Tax=Aspergillus fumigatus TaxID=746128 RepID=Q4WMM9_ASPFU|nr:C6 finger domain protein, putative [Aspergillus fumigatus Af293]EAL88785.1 C6 finger domain protein, putative [Aspergillus fumigatus Af293]EDP48556.1 C6 finger domain protein, putative [Aspergillus fumigatus A1163]